MLPELTRYSTALIKEAEVTHGELRILGTEPVTRANDTMVVLWWYPGLGEYELNTDYGNIRFSEEAGALFNQKGIRGAERIARASFRHGSIRATNRLKALLSEVQTNLDMIRVQQHTEKPITEEQAITPRKLLQETVYAFLFPK